MTGHPLGHHAPAKPGRSQMKGSGIRNMHLVLVPLGPLVEKALNALGATIRSQNGNVLFWNLAARFYLFMVLRLGSSASQVLGKCSTSKLHPGSRKSVSCIERRKKKKWNKTKRLSLDREYLPTPEIRTRHEVANDFSISLLEKDQERVLEHLQTQMSSWLQTKIFITSEEGLDGPVSKCVRDNWLAIWENQTSSFSQAMHRDGFQMAQRISMLKAKL